MSSYCCRGALSESLNSRGTYRWQRFGAVLYGTVAQCAKVLRAEWLHTVPAQRTIDFVGCNQVVRAPARELLLKGVDGSVSMAALAAKLPVLIVLTAGYAVCIAAIFRTGTLLDADRLGIQVVPRVHQLQGIEKVQERSIPQVYFLSSDRVFGSTQETVGVQAIYQPTRVTYTVRNTLFFIPLLRQHPGQLHLPSCTAMPHTTNMPTQNRQNRMRNTTSLHFLWTGSTRP